MDLGNSLLLFGSRVEKLKGYKVEKGISLKRYRVMSLRPLSSVLQPSLKATARQADI
jgi:hypothetical protein